MCLHWNRLQGWGIRHDDIIISAQCQLGSTTASLVTALPAITINFPPEKHGADAQTTQSHHVFASLLNFLPAYPPCRRVKTSAIRTCSSACASFLRLSLPLRPSRSTARRSVHLFCQPNLLHQTPNIYTDKEKYIHTRATARRRRSYRYSGMCRLATRHRPITWL